MSTLAIRKIRKNSRERLEMWDRATRAISYTLDNGFIGQDVTVEGAREWFDKMTERNYRTIDVTHNGRCYCVHYHSNHWVELLCPPGDAE